MPFVPFTRAENLTADRLNGALEAVEIAASGGLTPEMYGAVGDGVTDDSAAIAAMFSDAMRMRQPVRLGPKTYLLRSTTLPQLTSPVSIYGSGAQFSRLMAHSDYRGPVLYAVNWTGLQLVSPPDQAFGIEGSTVWADFAVVGSRSDDAGNLIPLGSQHGIIFTDFADCTALLNVVVENFRGWGINTAHGQERDTRGMREVGWFNVRVRNCGAGPYFAAWYFPGTTWNGSTSNNLYFHGCQVSIAQGPLLHFNAREGSLRIGRLRFYGLQLHNMNETQPADADIDFTQFSLLQLEGGADGIQLEGVDFNAAKDDQWTARIWNPYKFRVALSSDAVTTTSGSGSITLTLPLLPQRALVTGDITTEAGSPVFRVYWPSHTFTVGDFVTFDRWSGTTRLVSGLDLNGIRPRYDMRIVKVETDYISVMAEKGIATATGSVTLATGTTLNTLKGAYNLEPNSTFAFDTWVGGVRQNNAYTVGGLSMFGVWTVDTQTAVNVVTATKSGGLTASSTATSAVSGWDVEIAAGSTFPNGIRLRGKASSGQQGVSVEAGSGIDIDCQVPSPLTDFRVTDGIRGFVNFFAQGRESRYVLDVASSVRWLVNNYTAPESQLPIKAAASVVGALADKSERAAILAGSTTNATLRRLTDDGTTTISGPNVHDIVRSGVYRWSGTVTALQTAGSSGTAGDYAAWDVSALMTWGVSSGAVMQAVNGDVANVGTLLSPNAESSAGASAWRIKLSLDSTYNTLAVEVQGEANKTISWAAKLARLDNMTTAQW